MSTSASKSRSSSSSSSSVSSGGESNGAWRGEGVAAVDEMEGGDDGWL